MSRSGILGIVHKLFTDSYDDSYDMVWLLFFIPNITNLVYFVYI